jgi:predicted nucleic acid-binding protein
MDTSTYTHLCRAGYEFIIQNLAPHGVVLIPAEVNVEIENARERHPGIPSVSAVDWAAHTSMTDEEEWTALWVKAALGGGRFQHLGESAVIACAHHRSLIAVLDERAAIAQADRLKVTWIDTMGVVAKAYKSLFSRDRTQTVALVDALLATEMYLPFQNGDSFFAWALEEGILP